MSGGDNDVAGLSERERMAQFLANLVPEDGIWPDGLPASTAPWR